MSVGVHQSSEDRQVLSGSGAGWTWADGAAFLPRVSGETGQSLQAVNGYISPSLSLSPSPPPPSLCVRMIQCSPFSVTIPSILTVSPSGRTPRKPYCHIVASNESNFSFLLPLLVSLSSCPVCRYTQSPDNAGDNTCLSCDSREVSFDSHMMVLNLSFSLSLCQDLWICLICGNIGCGRYVGRHAHT